jgi:hypothetical protein
MERAAKLRAQYALQAQSLRMRLEMRVNRIPVALRKMTIGELLEKYEEGKENASRRVASPAKTISRVPQARLSPAKSALKPPQQRGTKRTRYIQHPSCVRRPLLTYLALPWSFHLIMMLMRTRMSAL